MLTVDGYRICQHCVRRAGATPADALRVLPGIFNHRTGIRHLLQEDEVTTHCGYNTMSQNWDEPWHKMMEELGFGQDLTGFWSSG